ncbi:hypothetical protein ACFQY0_17650 [Haloferula chungangensis]|uniref:Centromere protein X n=1 Tax=Haloferula chungangensis TaxID=1048331 RepID=A0ABW2LB46_9BACT
MSIEIDESDGSYMVRVLPILAVFQAKVANLSAIDQSGRNDLKHVNLMILVVRQFLIELIEAAESGMIDSRGAIIQLEHARKVVLSREAIRCCEGCLIDFDKVWPRQVLLASKDERLRNFVKHRLPA